MRLAIAHPCRASVESVLRIRRSRVPCTKSLGLPMPRLSTLSIVDSQGIPSQNFWRIQFEPEQRGTNGRDQNNESACCEYSTRTSFGISQTYVLMDHAR